MTDYVRQYVCFPRRQVTHIHTYMDNMLKFLEYRDCLRGFLAGRGTRTAAIEVKLTQQLAFLKQVPRYGVFIDLSMAYSAME